MVAPPLERVDDEFNGTIANSVLQSSAVEFQPSKPPPMIIPAPSAPRDETKNEENVVVAAAATPDESLSNQNHVDDVGDDYVNVEMVNDEVVVHIKPEVELHTEVINSSSGITTTSTATTTTGSTDETDKSVGVLVPDEIEYNTAGLMTSDTKTVSPPNVEEVRHFAFILISLFC